MLKAYRSVIDASGMAGAVALIVLALMVTVDVTVRWLTGNPIAGVFEYSGMALLTAIFLALAPMQERKLHIRVDFVSGRARGRWAALLEILDVTAGIAVFVMLAWAGAEAFETALAGSYRLTGLVQIPTIAPIGLVVFTAALVTVVLLRQLVAALRRIGSAEPDERPKA